MRLGCALPMFGPVAGPDALTRAAERAEALGYHSIWAADRLLYPVAPRAPYPLGDGVLPEYFKRSMDPLEALGLVNLDQRRDHFPAQLSGGEQQRVAIARAIAKRPSVLLCDEPTGALDISTGVVVLEALARVNAELGTTTIVITHNAAIAAMADRVIRLADGRVTGVEERTAKMSPRELSW